MKSAAALSAALALLSGTANAFWRMPCHDRTALLRLDPIVDAGTASSHGHAIHGGSNFAETTTYDMLRASSCTSCQFDDDKSAYWTPSLHFVHENETTEIVEQVGGMLAYYLLYGDDIKAFPKDFTMLAGDTRLRNFSGPEFMDENCLDGIRAEIFFPSCWNGKDASVEDHKSHMAYPDLIDGGPCPAGFDSRLPSLFYETIWNTYAFRGVAGQFVWSNGDPIGYGYHADFMNGWNIETLQSAVTDCTNLSGRVEDCIHFAPSLQTEQTQDQCKIQEVPAVLEDDDCAGPSDGLCGDVPVQYGPQYANPLEPGHTGAEPTVVPSLKSVIPVPTLSYAPARSMITNKWGGGVSVYNVEPSSASVAQSSPVAPAVTPASYPTAPVSAPATTSAVDVSHAAAPDGTVISTITYTSAGTVYEIAIEEVAVIVTVTESYKYKHRRHAHLHGRDREHGLLKRH